MTDGRKGGTERHGKCQSTVYGMGGGGGGGGGGRGRRGGGGGGGGRTENMYDMHV